MWALLLEFIGPLWAACSRLIFSRAGMWVVSTLVFLGIGFGTQQYALPAVTGYFQQGFGGLPANAAAWVGYFRIDVYCSIIVSAYAAAFAKRLILKRITGTT